MARSVSDAAILLGALSEKNQDYTKALVVNELKNARIGIASDFFVFHSGVERLMADAIHTLKNSGATIVENLKFENREEWEKLEWQVPISEFKADLNAYLGSRTGLKVQTLADLIEFNKANSEKELRWFGQEIFEEAEKTNGLNDPIYMEVLAKVHEMTRKNGINLLMDQHQLDALIASTNGPSWTIDLVNGDHFGGGSSEAAAISGYPAITVPAGFVQDLPVGISFFGRAWSETTLIQLAYAYEQATKHHKAPGFLTEIE